MSEEKQIFGLLFTNKKILVIILVVFILIISLIVSSCNKKSEEQKVNESATEQNLIITPQLATKEKIFEPFVQNGKVIYLSNYPDIQKEFYFYQLDLNNLSAQRAKTFDQGFNGVESIIYSSDGSKGFVKYVWPVYALTQNIMVDFKIKKQYELSKNISDLIFINGKNKIVYTYLDTDKVQLNISDPDGSNWQTLKNLDYDPSGYNLAMIDDDNIAYSGKSSRDKTLPLYKFNLTQKKEEVLYSEASIVSAVFSPDKNKLIGDIYPKGSTVPQIGILDLANNKMKLMGDIKSSSDSALWIDNDRLFIPSFDKDSSKKYLTILNTISGQKQTFEIKTQDDYSPLLNLTVDGGYLFFASGENLYKISLKELEKVT